MNLIKHIRDLKEFVSFDPKILARKSSPKEIRRGAEKFSMKNFVIA